YLAEKDFDEAIKYLDQAVALDPENAQLYSNLGAAWYEKSQAVLITEQAGKQIEYAAKALEYLNRALELKADSLEALFNRALCFEALGLLQNAIDDWQEYLNK